MVYLRSLQVAETIESMSNRRALGPDGLPDEMPKLVVDEDRDGNRRALEQFHAMVIATFAWRGRAAGVEICQDHGAAQEESTGRGVR